MDPNTYTDILVLGDAISQKLAEHLSMASAQERRNHTLGLMAATLCASPQMTIDGDRMVSYSAKAAIDTAEALLAEIERRSGGKS